MGSLDDRVREAVRIFATAVAGEASQEELWELDKILTILQRIKAVGRVALPDLTRADWEALGFREGREAIIPSAIRDRLLPVDRDGVAVFINGQSYIFDDDHRPPWEVIDITKATPQERAVCAARLRVLADYFEHGR